MSASVCAARRVAAFLLVAAGVVPPIAAGNGDGTNAEKPPPHVVSVWVRPRAIYRRSAVTLGLNIDPPCSEAHEIRWTASAGALLFDDLSEITWRAPESSGPASLAAVLSCKGRSFRAEVKVEARTPSTDGMVRIPAGTFLCGDVVGTMNTREAKTPENANDEPSHLVHLDAYWIDRHQVTNERYVGFLEDALVQGMVRVEKVAILGEFEGSWVPFYYFEPYDRLIGGRYGPGRGPLPHFLHAISWDGRRFRIEPGRERQPVVDVSWFGAAAYARFRGRELPTDAQWEKAARGTDGRRFPWGNNLPTPHHLSLGNDLQPVGSSSPQGDSPYGVADMVSACFEWTNDWFDANYYEDNLSDAPHRNPEGPFWGRAHSIRGFPDMRWMEVPAVEDPEPIANRYEWFFEFLVGDCFSDRSTTFRTVIPPDGGPSAP